MRTARLMPVSSYVEDVLARLRQPPTPPAPATGISDLDHLTGGLQRGALWTLSGVPGAGKSVLALGVARAVAVTEGRRALVLSGREPATELVERLLCAEAKVPLHHMRGGSPSEAEWTRLDAVRVRLLDVELDLGYAADPVDMAMSLKPGQALVVVDGIPAGGARLGHLRALRELAGRLQSAVLGVLGHDPLRTPDDADREAALVADVVLRLEDHSGDTQRAGEADLLVRHNRVGPVSTVLLLNQMVYARFVDPAS